VAQLPTILPRGGPTAPDDTFALGVGAAQPSGEQGDAPCDTSSGAVAALGVALAAAGVGLCWAWAVICRLRRQQPAAMRPKQLAPEVELRVNAC
jgi:hypothetical protein